MSLLRIENVTKRFGGLTAVDDISLEVGRDELVAIVGPNGAGKTTLFNILSGVFFPDQGRIFFEDQDITNLAPFRRAPLGMGRTFQIPRPFGSATVRENVAIGAMFGAAGKDLSVDQSMEIADRLCLAEGTVKNHVTNILTKLDVRDRTQAALRARQLGLT